MTRPDTAERAALEEDERKLISYLAFGLENHSAATRRLHTLSYRTLQDESHQLLYNALLRRPLRCANDASPVTNSYQQLVTAKR